MTEQNTYLRELLRSSLTLHQLPYEDGLMKVKSDMCNQIVILKEGVTDYITHPILRSFLGSRIIRRKYEFVMLELAQLTRKMILRDKLNTLMNDFQIPKSFKMSDLDSIGKDRDCDPFWNSFTKELSQKLWLPTETACVVLDSNCLSGSLKKTMSNSWFSIQSAVQPMPPKNWQTTFLPSLLSLLHEIMALEQVNIEERENLKEKQNPPKSFKLPAGKAKLVRIYPSKEETVFLKQAFGASRWVYNRCVSELRKGGLFKVNKNGKKTKTLLPIKSLRQKIINNSNFEIKNQWMLSVNYDIRDEALRDFIKNYKSNQAKGGNFKLKKRKRSDKESISILAKHWNRKSGYFSHIFHSKYKTARNEYIPKKLSYDTRFIKSNLNKYYIAIQSPLDIKKKNMPKKHKAIFIDPGIKNILCGYDYEGKMITLGKGDCERTARLLHYKHKLQSKIKKSKNHRKRYQLKKAFKRLCRKIRNIVTDFHKKVSSWITKEYNTIYLPKMNFHKMKKLNKKSKEKLATLRHCALFNRISDKTRENQSCKIHEVNEAFTSKTCCHCGNINNNLKNQNYNFCTRCGTNTYRDYNGAVNIMLRFLTKNLS